MRRFIEEGRVHTLPRILAFVILLFFGVALQDHDARAEWFDVPGLVWGPTNTNGVRAGIYPDGAASSKQVTVFVLPPTNVVWQYLLRSHLDRLHWGEFGNVSACRKLMGGNYLTRRWNT